MVGGQWAVDGFHINSVLLLGVYRVVYLSLSLSPFHKDEVAIAVCNTESTGVQKEIGQVCI